MQFLLSVLAWLCKISLKFPRSTILLFLGMSLLGFATMPFIKLSTNLIAGVGESQSIINLTKENNEIFGEQDSLIVVLEFPEPPGEARLPFIKALGEEIEQISGIRRVRYRFLDPDNTDHIVLLFKHFLLGMNQREREAIQRILSPSGVEAAFRRNSNRLFLADNPYIQRKILEDPLELGQFVAESMRTRIGSVSFGDIYLLIASPDSTVYLIQVTPDFPSSDLVRGKALLDRLSVVIPEKISSLLRDNSGLYDSFKGIKWHLTGKTVFHNESDRIFERDTSIILSFSFIMVIFLLFAVYRSFSAGLILFIPIAAGVGSNYGLTYLIYDEVNPVVMGATGVLFGLGTDYGVHLWGRLRDQLDGGATPSEAVFNVYRYTGPPLMLGGLTSILAFLCLCLSRQPAMVQFGYVGASGLALTLVSTLLMFPALVKIISSFKGDYFPRMRVSFTQFSSLFQSRPALIVAISAIVLVISIIFASKISYEKDLFKVFLAKGMDSTYVSDMIARKFNSNFSQPTHLSFDIGDFQKGLQIQRDLDEILQELMQQNKEIASFDSISYLLAPDLVQSLNIQFLSKIADSWPELEKAFSNKLKNSMLSDDASAVFQRSFDSTGKIIKDLKDNSLQDPEGLADVERAWYTTKIRGKYRFLTQIRYSNTVTDPNQLKNADEKILNAVRGLPIKIDISGPRQVMQEILSSLVDELMRLGVYVLVAVIIFFFATFRHPLGVILSLIPMIGAFAITLGMMGALGFGLPFSIVGVAPLIFGLGMDNGVHVVMGSLGENGSVSETMKHVTRPIIFTSLSNVMGFVAMLVSKHYSMQFLGWCMVIGMTSAVVLTLTTLPALLLLLESRKKDRPLMS